MARVPTTTATGSLWLDALPAGRLPPLTEDVDVDVAVLGGGITGLTTALLLKRRGARVAVLEARGCGAGVTGNSTAKVTALQSTVYGTITARHGQRAAEHYAQASLAAVDLVAELAEGLAADGVDCEARRRPAFTYAADTDQLATVREEARAAERAGLAVQLTGETDLPFPVAGAVRLDDQLELHPVRYLRGLADAVHGDGCVVYEDTPATEVSVREPFTVRTPRGVVRAGHVVVATHYPLLDRGLFFARLEPSRSYCIAARITGPAPTGLSISAGSPTRSIRSYQGLLVLGGESHPTGASAAGRFEALERFARRHWSVQEITHRWSAQDPATFDQLPMIGWYSPVSPRLLVATGYMKWGLTSGTFAAMMLADQISGTPNPWRHTFQPTRLSPRSIPTLARLNLKVAADLVGDRLRAAQELSEADVPPGQARVVGDHRDKTGVYREPDGTPHAVSLRCTHLGCLLRFNAAERSWDCPCHGSRFDVDGAVLEGPATRPLARRPVPGGREGVPDPGRG